MPAFYPAQETHEGVFILSRLGVDSSIRRPHGAIRGVEAVG